MVTTNQFQQKTGFGDKLLRWMNLREGEGRRTVLMFSFYTTTSSGLVWLEACAIDLFLREYGASMLPIIYIASSGIRIGLGLLYSWLQRFLPLRWVIVLIALVMAIPLPAFWIGLGYPAGVEISGFLVLKTTILLMQLWLEASHALNDLNASITANQLFNVREVKRTYPLISSGILVADVVSGFSLPFLLALLPKEQGLPTVIMLSFGMMLLGAGVLFYLSQAYQQSFPDFRKRREDLTPESTTRRIRGKMRNYSLLLLVFFAMAQVLLLLVEFQFLSHLGEQAGLSEGGESSGQVAGFLGIFNGTLGICELIMQGMFSSRLVDRIGVFAAMMTLPIVIVGLSGLSVSGLFPIFWMVVGLRFLYELLHYTLFTGISPVLFFSVPENIRDRLQAKVRGIAEPCAIAATGVALYTVVNSGLQNNATVGTLIFGMMVLLSLGWLVSIFFLRSNYVKLLVLNAGLGQLSGSEVDLRALKQAIVAALEKPGPEAEKRSCIELLHQIDPRNTGDILAPLLSQLPSSLQYKSLEVMLPYPNLDHVSTVAALLKTKPDDHVMATALRYIWLTEAAPDLKKLDQYLHPETAAVIRGTAAALMLRQGNSTEKAKATNTLRLMVTSGHRRERVMGCRALGDAVYLQALRVYVPNLLRDPALEVRQAMIEAIGATRLEEHYPYLLQGIQSPATRDASVRALTKLENDALPMLVSLGTDLTNPELVQSEAWNAIGEIGTPEAIDRLIAHLTTSWGHTRRCLLKTLLKIPQERGIEIVLDRIGRRGLEALINQEMMFIGQMYAALADLIKERVQSNEGTMLRRTLHESPSDGIERIFLLMKFLYPPSAIQAAAFNLQSDSRSNVAQGLEILDNTLDLANKRALIALIDRNVIIIDKLQSLADLVTYTPMSPPERLKYLMDLRHFMSDWGLACCFHLARRERWSLTTDQITAGFNHPRGFVRESALSYLHLANPMALARILPNLATDPDPIVVGQAKKVMAEFARRPKPPVQRDRDDDLPIQHK